MRQQVADAACRLGRQASQDILQVGQGFVTVELGRLNQTHDRGSAFAGAQAAGK